MPAFYYDTINLEVLVKFKLNLYSYDWGEITYTFGSSDSSYHGIHILDINISDLLIGYPYSGRKEKKIALILSTDKSLEGTVPDTGNDPQWYSFNK